MGITHVVLFTPKAELGADAVKDICNRLIALKDNCIDAKSQKPYIKSTACGTDNSIEGRQNGLTHAYVAEFESAEDRDYYVKQDPAHLAILRDVGPLLEKLQIVDFTPGVY